jgi:hypothetical protein
VKFLRVLKWLQEEFEGEVILETDSDLTSDDTNAEDKLEDSRSEITPGPDIMIK